MSSDSLRQVEELVDELSFEEQLDLVGYLASRLQRTTRTNKPRKLGGIWKGRFPVDFDIDAALRDIRSGWLKRDIGAGK